MFYVIGKHRDLVWNESLKKKGELTICMHGRHLQTRWQSLREMGCLTSKKADNTTTLLLLSILSYGWEVWGPMGKCCDLKSGECLGRLSIGIWQVVCVCVSVMMMILLLVFFLGQKSEAFIEEFVLLLLLWWWVFFLHDSAAYLCNFNRSTYNGFAEHSTPFQTYPLFLSLFLSLYLGFNHK